MLTPKRASAARREADRAHRGLAEDIRRLREDAGATKSELAKDAGVDVAYLGRIEDARSRPSLDTYARLALALGADLGVHLYPNTGPRIRDRHQARMLEFLLGELDSRWQPFLEVGVRHPSRGWIDAVLHDERARCLVATEIQSDLRRLEQQLRWFAAKTESLPSWEGWRRLGEIDVRSQLLLIRATNATRAVGHEFARLLAASYPAHPEDAVAALTGRAPWPGSAVVWLEVAPERARFIPNR